MIKQAHQGNTPTLQGSNDGQSWTTLTTISAAGYSDEWTDQRRFRHVTVPLNHSELYDQYRYHALPGSFLWVAYFDIQ